MSQRADNTISTKRNNGCSLEDCFERSFNSIGFLRLALAILVVVHHSFTLRHGWGADPLWRLTGQFDLGTLAVASFLVLSGFLISASYERSSRLSRYFFNRALRLYPGFWVCLIVSIAVIGPLAWSIEYGSIGDYFRPRAGGPLDYFVSNLSLWIRQTTIAGLFQSNVSKYVNGSLWMLSLEAICYVTLPLLAFAGGLRKRRWLALGGLFIGWIWYLVDAGWLASLGVHIRMFSLLKIAIYFAAGVVFYAYRSKVQIKSTWAAIGVLGAIASVPLGLLSLVLLIVLPYLLLWLAFTIPLNNWEKKADLSYGVYVYAYPIQQLLLVAWPGINSAVFLVASLVIVLPVALMSWKFIEKPALSFKRIGIRPAMLTASKSAGEAF